MNVLVWESILQGPNISLFHEKMFILDILQGYLITIEIGFHIETKKIHPFNSQKNESFKLKNHKQNSKELEINIEYLSSLSYSGVLSLQF